MSRVKTPTTCTTDTTNTTKNMNAKNVSIGVVHKIIEEFKAINDMLERVS